MSNTETLAMIVARILDVFPGAERILLYGSRASGAERPDSDFDLLVVTQTHLAPAMRGVRARLALRGLDAAFDVTVVTPEELARLSDWKSSVIYKASREGIVLYEAA